MSCGWAWLVRLTLESVLDVTHRQATLFLEDKTRAWRLHPNTRNQAMGMLEVTCVPAIMEETLIREYTVNLPTLHICGFYPTGALPWGHCWHKTPHGKSCCWMRPLVGVIILIMSSTNGLLQLEQYEKEKQRFLTFHYVFPLDLFIGSGLNLCQRSNSLPIEEKGRNNARHKIN